VADPCKHGNESSLSIKCGEFLDKLRTGQVLKKDCAPRTRGTEVLGTFVKERKAGISLVVCLSACNNSAPSGRISMKFDIGGLLANLSRKFMFH
jgi:hypothetical protein